MNNIKSIFIYFFLVLCIFSDISFAREKENRFKDQPSNFQLVIQQLDKSRGQIKDYERAETQLTAIVREHPLNVDCSSIWHLFSVAWVVMKRLKPALRRF